MKWNINKFLIVKIMAKKNNSESKSRNLHFPAFVALIAGVSGYAIVSFVSSTNDYVDYMEANVLGSSEVGSEEVVGEEVAGEEVASKVDYSDNPFLDLRDDHPNREAVLFLYHEGVVKGDDFGRFNPDAKVSRAEAVKMVLEAAKFDLLAYDNLENCFGDVKTVGEHWFAAHVCGGKGAGYFKGNADGNFYPNAEVSKAEALKMVLTAFDFEIKDNSKVMSVPYVDVNSEDWFLGVAEAANREGLIKPSEIFDGGRLLSRAEVAQVILNAMEKR